MSPCWSGVQGSAWLLQLADLLLMCDAHQGMPTCPTFSTMLCFAGAVRFCVIFETADQVVLACRYGPDAGSASRDMAAATYSAASTVRSVSQIRRLGATRVAKKVARRTAKGIVKSWVVPNKVPANNQQQQQQQQSLPQASQQQQQLQQQPAR